MRVTDGSVAFARGVDMSPVATEMQPDEASVLLNLRVSMQGQQLEPRGAPEIVDSIGSGGVWGLAEFVTAAGQHQIVRVRGFTVEYSTDYGVTWTTISTSATYDDEWWTFVTMRVGSDNLLIGTNGGGSTYKWDGSTWAALSNIPNDVKYLAVFGERLIAAGHSGIDVVASAVGDVDTWAIPAGWTIKASTHDGDTEIRGLLSIGSILLIFKKKSVGYTEGYGYETLQVATGARGIARSVGLRATRSLQPIGESGVMWLSDRGFEFLSLGNMSVTLVSRPVQKFIDGITGLDDDPGLACSLYWPEKNEYWCAVPTVISDENTYIYVFRPPTEASLPAHTFLWFHAYIWSTIRGLVVDDDGYLGFQSVISELFHHKVMGVDRDGYFVLEDHPVPGAFAQSANAVLSIGNQAAWDPMCMATMDASDRPAQPWVHSSGLLLLCDRNPIETTDGSDGDPNSTSRYAVNDVVWCMVTRPFFFRDQHTRKRAERIWPMVRVEGLKAAEVTIYNITDGVRGSAHEKTVPVSPGPQELEAKVGGRGFFHQAAIYGTDKDVRILSVAMAAKMLRER